MDIIPLLHPLPFCTSTCTVATLNTPLLKQKTGLLFRNRRISSPIWNWRQRRTRYICCSSANDPSSSTSSKISSATKLRSEVLSPFRPVRMFFYVAFIASASLGGLISLTQLIPALVSPMKSQSVPTILQSFGIDLGAVLLFAFLYTRENKAKNAQEARLSREERLSKLRLRLSENKIVSMEELRGVSRLVIVAGPSSFLLESFERCKAFANELVERGVLVVPFCTEGDIPDFKLLTSVGEMANDEKIKRLWQLTPVYFTEWAQWLDEQKKLANVAPDSPVYLSLRMDGRVRGSGVGYPPWNAFVAQLPPVKGLWSGLFDGMDGRV
ncbi:LOW PSII ACCUMULATION-like protein [Carex rostrata]